MKDLSLFQFLVDHVFLPNKLPKNNDDSNIETKEIYFLHTLNEFFHENDQLNSQDQIQEIMRLFSKWELLQIEQDPKQINTEILNLKQNESFALYLKPQNATILISKLSTGQNYSTVVSCFGVNAKNSSVMSLNGCLKSRYPWYSFYSDNVNFLESKQFSYLLTTLGKEDVLKIFRTTRKGDVDVPEKRDVQDPRFVIEWLSSFIAGDSPMSNYPKKIMKKVRDEVNYSKGYLPFRRSGN